LESIRVDGRIILKRILEKIRCERCGLNDSSGAVKGADKWLVLVNTVMNLRVP